MAKIRITDLETASLNSDKSDNTYTYTKEYPVNKQEQKVNIDFKGNLEDGLEIMDDLIDKGFSCDINILDNIIQITGKKMYTEVVY